MLYGFVIAPSINFDEPGEAYLQELERVAATRVNSEEAWDAGSALDVCEYLDYVDSGAAANKNKVFYTQCVAGLSNYFDENMNSMCAHALLKKSWAAQTIYDLVRASHARKKVANLRVC